MPALLVRESSNFTGITLIFMHSKSYQKWGNPWAMDFIQCLALAAALASAPVLEAVDLPLPVPLICILFILG